MGDLPKVIGKDDQKYNNSEAEHELAAGNHDQRPMLFFNLVLGLYLTFLYCYINLELLIALAILVFSGFIHKHLHNAGGHHTPEIPNEDQDNKVDEPETETENKHGQEILLEIEDVENTRQEADKFSQVDDDDDDEEKLEIHRGVYQLQSGNHWEEVSIETIQTRTSTSQRNEHQKKRNKKKNKKKVDGIVEGILEGVLDTTNVVIDISTGGMFSIIGYIFWR